MALHGNYSVLYKSPGNWRSGGATGQGMDRPNFNRSGPARNRYSTYVIDPYTAHPLGKMPGNALVIPQKSGGVGTRNSVQGSGDLSGAGAMGKNAEATLSGAALAAAVGQLVVSAAALIAGQADVSANILAALAASASLAGQGDTAGAISALAWANAAIEGTADLTAVPYAVGFMDANIDVAATQDLTAAAIADEILDQNMVEIGLTVRETLRLCAAALAGKVSISGSTVTIRNAVADDADRIVATTTTDGERTAITYDLS